MKRIFLIALAIMAFISVQAQITVKYQVNCSDLGFTVTYFNESGNIEMQKINSYEWSKTMKLPIGSFVSLSAQSMSANTSISTDIYYNYVLAETSNSNGDYVLASASGTVYKPVEKPKKQEAVKPLAENERTVYENSPILDSPKLIGKTIGTAKDCRVEILNVESNGYYRVKSNGVTGYMSIIWFPKR